MKGNISSQPASTTPGSWKGIIPCDCQDWAGAYCLPRMWLMANSSSKEDWISRQLEAIQSKPSFTGRVSSCLFSSPPPFRAAQDLLRPEKKNRQCSTVSLIGKGRDRKLLIWTQKLHYCWSQIWKEESSLDNHNLGIRKTESLSIFSMIAAIADKCNKDFSAMNLYP